jgi:hypothetical protein
MENFHFRNNISENVLKLVFQWPNKGEKPEKIMKMITTAQMMRFQRILLKPKVKQKKLNFTITHLVILHTPGRGALHSKLKLEDKSLRIEWEGASAFLQKGGIIGFNDISERTLCKLNIINHCNTQYIADVIDTMYAFCPRNAPTESATIYYLLQDNFIGYANSIGTPVLY